MNINFLLTPRKIGPAKFAGEFAEAGHECSFILFAYWAAKRGTDDFIRREALVPRELVRLLPWLFIFEPKSDDWRIRLIGTRLCGRLGADITGWALAEVFDRQSAENLVRMFNTIVSERDPKVLKGDYIEQERATATTEAVLLPMLARDGHTMHILGGAFFEERRIE